MISATFSPVTAGNVNQQPDPELLRKFEAERDGARADKLRAQEKQKRAEDKIQQGEAKKHRALSDLDAELCRLGALPASECP